MINKGFSGFIEYLYIICNINYRNVLNIHFAIQRRNRKNPYFLLYSIAKISSFQVHEQFTTGHLATTIQPISAHLAKMTSVNYYQHQASVAVRRPCSIIVLKIFSSETNCPNGTRVNHNDPQGNYSSKSVCLPCLSLSINLVPKAKNKTQGL